MIFALAIFMISCSDDDPTTPACIEDISDVFETTACAGTGDLTLWTFNGQDVYCFNPGTCIADAGADIYDADCNKLCVIGGISGNTTCAGLDWASNATLEETLKTY